MKKCLSVVLALVLTLTIIPLSVSAGTSDGYEYEILSETDKTCVITGYSGNGRNLVIPATLDGYKVVKIGDYAFRDNLLLRTVEIPYGVETIGEYVFYGCTTLNTVTVSSSVKVIEQGAFFDCERLGTVTLPDTVEVLGRNVFYDTLFIEVDDEDKDDDKVIINRDNWTDGTLYIGKHLIAVSPEKTGSFTIKADTVTIGGDAFGECTKITSVSIPNTVRSIGEYAFYNCDGLTKVSVPESVKFIGRNAFGCCDNLKTVNIPSKVTEIADWAFSGCKALTSVTVPGTVERIGNGAYTACKNLSTVKISSGVKSVGKAAFYDCTALSSVTIADSVTEIGQIAFVHTNYYNTSSKWSNNALYIGNHLIGVRSGVSGAYTVKSGTKAIAEDAFYTCKSVTSISLPDSVTGISDGAFKCCTALKEISVSSGNGTYSAVGGVLYNKAKTNLICYPMAKTGSTFEVPKGVTEIAPYSFYTAKNLSSVTLSDGIKSIGTYAFYDNNGLTTVEVPVSVSQIGEWAFAGCEKLKLLIAANTVAEQYAQKENIPYEYITLMLHNSGVYVIAEKSGILSAKSALDVTTAATDEGIVYSIALKEGNSTTQPKGYVTVKIPIPDDMDTDSCKLYRVVNNGYSYMDITKENGYLVFVTDNLGSFLVTKQIISGLAGDVNGDGKVSSLDARIVLQVAAEKRTATEEEKAAMDINGDKRITSLDARKILQISVGLI